jgi:dipeptidyl aminopeptidase/acylaminoacyl peptidase
MRAHRLGFIAIAVIALTITAGAATKRPVKVDDFARLLDLADPQVSPDGEWVLYTVASTDAAADRRRTDIWRVKWDGTGQSRVTYGAGNESAPRWSPDGRLISFLSARPGETKGTQVWLLDRRGGEAQPLTQLKGRIASYEWSPDSTHLLLVYRESDAPEPDPKAPPKPLVIDKYQFKRDGQGYLTGSARSKLYLFEIASHKLEALTSDGDYDESNPRWSPDGRRIAFVSNHDKDWERTRNTDVFVVEAAPGSKSRQLTTSPGADGGTLSWSPDGSLIAFEQGSEPKFDFHNLNRVAIVPAVGGAPRVLTTSLDRGTSAPTVTEDGRFVEFTVADDRQQYLARVSLAGGAIERLTKDSGSTLGYARAKGHTAFVSSADTAPPEVSGLDASGVRRLTTHNAAAATELEFVAADDISFPSKDGTEVHALLTTPIGYTAGKRYPTLVRIHGGPTAQDAHAFQFERQLFAANGYAVLNINYRGSSGRGAKFSQDILANWGVLEVEDVLAGVDAVVKQGIADPDRLGIGGWSYGGVLTDYIIASDTRFKAAISGAGSANHISLYGHDQYVFLYDNEFGPPWKNPDLWIKYSYPFFHADRIRTPTLFLGGQDDFNVPILGGEQMYQALKTLNVPTQLVVYPGQNHGLTRASFLRDRFERYLAWYDKYLKAAAADATTSSAAGSR